jgi:serine protease Do
MNIINCLLKILRDSIKFKKIVSSLFFILIALTVFKQNSYNAEKIKVKFGLIDTPLKQKSLKAVYEMEDISIEIYNLYRDRIVNILTEKNYKRINNKFLNDPFFKSLFSRKRRHRSKNKIQKLGSGFIISEDGYICTNFHVIRGIEKIKVEVNNKYYDARVIGGDLKTDVALIKINSDKKLKPVFIGNSDRIRVGAFVFAMGNPFGFEKTITFGIISMVPDPTSSMNDNGLIQTDTAINPGNSGGPLINSSGEVIGMNCIRYSSSGNPIGIGLSIPINRVAKIIDLLAKYGKVKRPYIGITLLPFNKEMKGLMKYNRDSGVIVSEVMKNSPSEKGELLKGDVIMTIDNKKMLDPDDVINYISGKKINSVLEFKIWRNKEIINLKIQIEEK